MGTVTVLLQERIRSLGQLGQQVSVKAGYARNYLIPQGKAVYATPDNINQFELKRLELEKKELLSKESAQLRASTLEVVILELPVQCSEEGKLYGSIGVSELSRAFKEKGFDIHRNEILLSGEPFKQTGEYSVTVELYNDVIVSVKVHIIPEKTATAS